MQLGFDVRSAAIACSLAGDGAPQQRFINKCRHEVGKMALAEKHELENKQVENGIFEVMEGEQDDEELDDAAFGNRLRGALANADEVAKLEIDEEAEEELQSNPDSEPDADAPELEGLDWSLARSRVLFLDAMFKVQYCVGLMTHGVAEEFLIEMVEEKIQRADLMEVHGSIVHIVEVDLDDGDDEDG